MSGDNINDEPSTSNGNKGGGDKDEKGNEKKVKPDEVSVVLAAISEEKEKEKAAVKTGAIPKANRPKLRFQGSGDIIDEMRNPWHSCPKCRARRAAKRAAAAVATEEPQPSTSSGAVGGVTNQLDAMIAPLEDVINKHLVPALLMWTMLTARRHIEAEQAKKRKEKKNRKGSKKGPKDSKGPQDPKDPEEPPPPPKVVEWNIDEVD